MTLEQIVKYVKRKDELQNMLKNKASNADKTSESFPKYKEELEEDSPKVQKSDISVAGTRPLISKVL